MAEVIQFSGVRVRETEDVPAAERSAPPFLNRWAVLAVLLLLSLIVIARAAWMSDDAYITLRVVDNAASGYGLRWNVAERVQVYTHPLWLFVMFTGYAVTGEPYYTVLSISIICSLSALFLLGKACRTVPAMAVVFAVLLSSKAFIDYTSSGLENPLSYLIVAAFALVYLHPDREPSVLTLSLITALATLNRMDLILLFLPALVHAAAESGRSGRRPLPRIGRDLLVGFSPFVAWEVFSIIYYGFPFPNTAYAKLGAGIPSLELAAQGVRYFQNSLLTDPVTLPAIAVSMAFAIHDRAARPLLLLAGVLLYLIYVVRIGGDFMSGRFFAVPLFAASWILARRAYRPLAGGVLAATAVAGGLFAEGPSLLYGEEYERKEFDAHGISDERGFYYQATGLLRANRDRPAPDHSWAEQGREARRQGALVVVGGNIGFFGFFAGPQVYVIDVGGLADPFLSRLDAHDKDNWRIGHFSRAIPAGYDRTVAASLVGGDIHLQDEKLRTLFKRITTITRGPVWRWDRFREIFLMNLGLHESPAN